MMKLRKIHAFCLGFATLSAATAMTPAAATTISITPQIWDFIDPTYSNNFHLNVIGPNQANTASVGRQFVLNNSPLPQYADYSAILEFAIPTLPTNAVLTDISLTVIAFLGDRLGDVQLRTYVAKNTAPDPGRLYAGTLLSNNYYPSQSGTITDLFSTEAAANFEENPGYYLGFAIRETNTRCPLVNDCHSMDILGSSSAPAAFPAPILLVTYEIPVLTPTPVPDPVPVSEPSTLALLAVGVAGLATARRRRASLADYGRKVHLAAG